MDTTSHELPIFPNPADEFISIYLPDKTKKIEFIWLFDLIGNLVYENRNIYENNYTFITRELASGMYVIRIGYDGGLLNSKILIVH